MSEGAWAPLGRLARQPKFLACAAVLAVSAAGLQLSAQKLKWHFRKEAAPLRKSLDELDESQLEPYRVRQKIKVSNPDVEEALGTKEYIQWVLEDTSVPEADAARLMMLFVTYYTGNPDKVPHIPERCYVGGGGDVGRGRNLTLTAPGCGLASKADQLPVRLLEMEVPGGLMGRRAQVVAYFFAVNGGYAVDRNEVRNRLNSLTNRYAYFSKVEVSFAGGQSPEAQEAPRAVEKLCRVVAPVLYKEHWPDWEALKGRRSAEPARPVRERTGGAK